MIFFELAAAGVLTLVLSAVLWINFRGRPAYPDPWETAAEACRLTRLGPATWAADGEGPFRDLLVRFGEWSEGEDSNIVRGTLIVVGARDHGIVSLSLWPETTATARAKERGAREIETGDDGFDDEFYVTGPSTVVRAVLDAETRRLLRSLLVEVDLQIVNGELRGRVVRTAESPPLHGLLLSRTLPLLLDAARRLRRPVDMGHRLAHNATTDPEPGVRRENLLALVRDDPDAPLTRETLRAACADRSDDVCVRAAAALGDEGLATLLALARDAGGDDRAAGRAVAALGHRLTAEDAHAILAHSLRSRRLETALACLASLGRRNDAGAIPVLAKVLALETGEIAVAAAKALAETGLPAAETPLLAALARDLPELRVASANALGRVGSVAAVPPLKDLESRSSDEATRRAAREAAAAIQSRLPGASPGQLSLAAADAGALSLAEDETGRLSLDEDKKR